MSTFAEAFEAWRRVPFPMGSPEDDLDELHADIALADTWVAESVIPFAEQGTFVPAAVDVLHELQALNDRAMRFGETDPVAEYLAYVGLLADVYEAFLREGGQTTRR